MYGLKIDRHSDLSITRQLTGQLREMILSGELPAGTRLPATRSFAAELSIARNTVIEVYDQLIAEGYLSGQTGSGTYVEDLSHKDVAKANQKYPKMRAVTPEQDARDVIAFESGIPDYRHFPRAAWARACKEACLSLPERAFGTMDLAGDEALRREMAAHLSRAKGIACDWEQVLIVPGATSGVEVAAWGLKAYGIAAIEDPCVDFMRMSFARCGYKLHSVPVDEQGMRAQEMADLTACDLIYVVPSHQFPTGCVLPIRRRLELLKQARRLGAYIIEDDYDSEFRYEGEPIQALRHLDPERVIYLGSFSKIFSPTLRMGYMIVPWEVLSRVRGAMDALNLSAPVILQRAVMEFLKSGQLERHVMKMKRVYAQKRLLLIQELQKAFGRELHIYGANAGMHLMVSPSNRDLCGRDFEQLRTCGVEAEWSEAYTVDQGTALSGIILGYGALTEEQIVEGVKRLKRALLPGEV